MKGKDSKLKLVHSFVEALEKIKIYSVYIFVCAIVGYKYFPNLVLGENKEEIIFGLFILILFFIIQTLFSIHRDTHQNHKIQKVSAGKLNNEILKLIKKSGRAKIKCIGIAGRFGWTNVISPLLRPDGNESILALNDIDIEIALISDNELNSRETYEDFKVVTENKRQIINRINNLNAHANIKLYEYDYMPNIIGFLINDSKLFLTNTTWTVEASGARTLRGGGTDYLVYDRFDGHGGGKYIGIFEGWFDYIRYQHNKKTNVSIDS